MAAINSCNLCNSCNSELFDAEIFSKLRQQPRAQVPPKIPKAPNVRGSINTRDNIDGNARQIRYIDDFLRLCNHEGIFAGSTKPNESENKNNNKKAAAYEISIDIPENRGDALDLIRVFEITYNGTYPFGEVLDIQWLLESFADRRHIWRVFRMNDVRSPDFGRIIGCWLWIIDYKKRLGYNRGFNLLPEYHGKIAIARLTYKVYRRLMLELRPHIDRWYNESRTAHSKSQYLSHGGGAHTHALLLNKDYFMGKKESDAMMCAYFRDAVEYRRIAPSSILPEIFPLYSLAMKIYDISEKIELGFVEFRADPDNVERIFSGISADFEPDAFGYIHFNFTDAGSGSYIKGLHTPSVKNIEKISYKFGNTDAMFALISVLGSYVAMNDIEYVEWRVRASDISVQGMLLQNMVPVGYIPCWSPVCGGGCEDAGDAENAGKSENGHSGAGGSDMRYEDVVVFCWMDRSVNSDNLHLTGEGRSLLSVIRSNMRYPASRQVLTDLS